jgi:hypothetical protein
MDAPYSPSNLTSLKDLRIRFRDMAPLILAKLLDSLVRCIAGDSHLERLDLKSMTSRVLIVGLHAPELIIHVLSTHSDSLYKLKIPIIHPSSSHLQQILTNCKHLETLWIGVNRDLMVNEFSSRYKSKGQSLIFLTCNFSLGAHLDFVTNVFKSKHSRALLLE